MPIVLLFFCSVYAAPLLQDVQQHAVIRALVDGTRHQDEQSSSGRAAEIALSLVARMNSNDQYPQSRRKRPDEKIANIRTEFDRSKLASVLVRYLFSSMLYFILLIWRCM